MKDIFTMKDYNGQKIQKIRYNVCLPQDLRTKIELDAEQWGVYPSTWIEMILSDWYLINRRDIKKGKGTLPSYEELRCGGPYAK